MGPLPAWFPKTLSLYSLFGFLFLLSQFTNTLWQGISLDKGMQGDIRRPHGFLVYHMP